MSNIVDSPIDIILRFIIKLDQNERTIDVVNHERMSPIRLMLVYAIIQTFDHQSNHFNLESYISRIHSRLLRLSDVESIRF